MIVDEVSLLQLVRLYVGVTSMRSQRCNHSTAALLIAVQSSGIMRVLFESNMFGMPTKWCTPGPLSPVPAFSCTPLGLSDRRFYALDAPSLFSSRSPISEPLARTSLPAKISELSRGTERSDSLSIKLCMHFSPHPRLCMCATVVLQAILAKPRL